MSNSKQDAANQIPVTITIKRSECRSKPLSKKATKGILQHLEFLAA